MHRLSLVVSIAALLAGGSVAAAPTNLVSNSGFESGMTSWQATGFQLQGYDYGIDGMSYAGTSAFYGGGITTPGMLSQTLATVSGQLYELSFYFSSSGDLPNSFAVAAGGNSLYQMEDVLLQGYTMVSRSFRATSTTTNLSFSLRNDAGLFRLDEITVAAVPEPETYLLMAGGLLAVWISSRRRAAVSAAKL